jgi:hypothetical protein
MSHDDLSLERRLRAAAPRIDEAAFDPTLLARVREQPVAGRSRPRTIAIPVAAGATLTATAVVMLAGGPADVGGPSPASAVTQALRWLDPPAGTVLHARSIERQGGRTVTREWWQSADDPGLHRERFTGARAYETSGDALYDPATNTIYEGEDVETESRLPPEAAALPAADPIIVKVRILLERGHMTVTGRVRHDGADAWEIALRPGQGRPVWKLWVSAADGRPLELSDPGRDAGEPAQEIRWPAYEVLPDAQARGLLTLRGAHPTAHVTREAAQTQAAQRRLVGETAAPTTEKTR